MLENLGTETATWGKHLRAGGAGGEEGRSTQTTWVLDTERGPDLLHVKWQLPPPCQEAAQHFVSSLPTLGNEDLAKPPSASLFFFFNQVFLFYPVAICFSYINFFIDKNSLSSLKTVF